MAERLKYGQVGGDLKALIGECHRKALGMEPRAELVCGCYHQVAASLVIGIHYQCGSRQEAVCVRQVLAVCR